MGWLTFVFAFALLLSACSTLQTVKDFIFPLNRVKVVSIITTSNMNEGYAIPLDIVFVNDKELLQTLSGTKAKEWFAGREDYMKQYPAKIRVAAWEVVPGQDLEDIDVSAVSKGSIGAVVYARYNNIDQQKQTAVVQDISYIAITLDKSAFNVVAYKPRHVKGISF
jgi:hypothetical protein